MNKQHNNLSHMARLREEKAKSLEKLAGAVRFKEANITGYHIYNDGESFEIHLDIEDKNILNNLIVKELANE